MITLGHLSDLHATDPSRANFGALLNKRMLGWLSWRLKRSRLYRREVVAALFEDIQRESPDHVAVTGDLVNIALPQEFEAAADMLRELGSPAWVSVVPGNHDAYVGLPRERAWALWSGYLESDAASPGEPAPAVGSARNSNMFPFPEMFPTVRIRGDLALVGVCTALPTAPFMATGMAGETQLLRLESTLEELRARDLCRVVLVHHPVVDAHVSRRRRSSDSARLRLVLERAGAELVIHGHDHRSEFSSLAGREGPIPVVGVRSASYVGPDAAKTAQYHIYQIERTAGGVPSRFQVSLRVRGWDASARSFVDVGTLRPLPL
ncbi:MAG: metallophosphoesterase [bacterium]|nr:metallophosphoesterase [bacterium]